MSSFEIRKYIEKWRLWTYVILHVPTDTLKNTNHTYISKSRTRRSYCWLWLGVMSTLFTRTGWSDIEKNGDFEPLSDPVCAFDTWKNTNPI
jgi:hypothetical protein